MRTASDDNHLWPGRPSGSEQHPPHRFRRPYLTPEVRLKETDQVPGTVPVPHHYPGGDSEVNLELAANHLRSAEAGTEPPATWRHMKRTLNYQGIYLDWCRERVTDLRAEVEERERRGDWRRELREREQAIRNNRDALYTWALLNERHRPIGDASGPEWEHYIADYTRVHGRPPQGVEQEDPHPAEEHLTPTVAQPALF